MRYFEGLMFSLTVQLAIGPVFFALLHKSVRQGLKHALAMGLAVSLSDGLYMLISLFGAGKLLMIPFISTGVYWLISAVMVIYGLQYIKKARAVKPGSLEAVDELTAARHTDKAILINSGNYKYSGSFLFGLKLNMSNLLPIIFWTTVFSGLMSSGYLQGTMQTSAFYLGCVTSSFIFTISVSFLGRFIKRLLSDSILKVADYTIGVILIIAGTVLAVSGAFEIFACNT